MFATTDVVQAIRCREDADYVATARHLNHLHIEMRRSGATAPLLVRRAWCEIDAGIYRAALKCARNALTLDGNQAEALYVQAHACLYLGLAAAGVVEAAPGSAPSKVHARRELACARDTLTRYLHRSRGAEARVAVAAPAQITGRGAP